jgi:hypothetical protein
MLNGQCVRKVSRQMAQLGRRLEERGALRSLMPLRIEAS